ncbi:U-box domain-containing protein 4 [Heracleum sosnowskyi]|uniref:U-box domain-containing protein 4 n=1 Tax=Heracleum sosnowskyi TaxID=360622 RepID=A0AAD8MMK8_9APIA|nr:U-box domain-containing protein 4 [Heracleum sosnowskyi]
MVSVSDSPKYPTRFPTTRPYYYTPPPSSSKSQRPLGRSMRTIRSTLYQSHHLSENLTDSVIDHRLGELANKQTKTPSFSEQDFLEFSKAFSDFSACSSDISGELQRLATLPGLATPGLSDPTGEPESEPCEGFLQRESFSTEIIECISPEDLLPTVKICIDGLNSSSIAVKRSAAAKLRLLAKNRADNRALIAESGAVPCLIHLLRSSDPWTQEHAVTALLNLSLLEENKVLVTDHGAIKPLIYVLKTGTKTSKQNAACAILNLSYLDENKVSVGASGAIPPLVALLRNGTNRGKKDAITTLYKICSVNVNKERAVAAGVVKLLVEMVAERGSGMAEKAMVVLSSLAGTERGRDEIVEEGGIPALVEAIEDGSMKGKEFAVVTLLQLCSENVRNRGLLVREGVIPPLVALSQSGTAKAKLKAETLLGYLREPSHEASSSSPKRYLEI